MEFRKKLWIGIIILTLISPIGILLPMKFKAGDAWGEWSVETIHKMLGFVPVKLKETSGLWKAPVADYNLSSERSPLYVHIVSYIFSGAIGVGIILLTILGIKKLLKNE